jgi:Big-like domain-containing protein
MVVAAAVAASALAACDPPPAEDVLLGPEPQRAFAVESVGVERAGGPTTPVTIRFTRDFDAATVGPRSVRVTRAGTRRPLRVRAWGSGRDLRVAPPPGRAFPAGATLLLHLDGAPSPRGIRSPEGEPLAHPFEAEFTVPATRADLVGPVLVDTLPADGSDDVAPGSAIELRFDEPIAARSLLSGDAVTLRVDGEPAPARLTRSGDGTMIVVHPATPLPPDRRVTLDLHSCLLDEAGNPLDATSKSALGFRTRATSLLELSEDFVDDARSDARATSCAWDDPETPGMLLARNGTVLVGADSGEPPAGLADASVLHFQVLIPPGEVPGGLASALRLEFATAPEGAEVVSAVVEAGPSTLDQREPSFAANRAASELEQVARVDEPTAIEPAADGNGRAWAEILFEEPLILDPGRAVLVDVRVETSVPVRVAAYPDAGVHALVEGSSGLAPAASLVVAPLVPQARSLWYDTGVAYPGWSSSIVTPTVPGLRLEFQSAPPSPAGGPDTSRASPWESDLSRLWAFRFVRFRVRFESLGEGAAAPRIDRIVLPYER